MATFSSILQRRSYMADKKSIAPERYPRIAIITGATSGIGEATARKFVAGGFGVVGNARNAKKLQALEQELGAAFCGVAGDATDSALPDRLFASATERFGKPADIVVINAGRGLGGSVKDADLSKFEAILKLNVTGALALLQKAAQIRLSQTGCGYRNHRFGCGQTHLAIQRGVRRHQVCRSFAGRRPAARSGTQRRARVTG
jgi:NAD(P)-dependent dehydrogenase (short-subunit alcohol dehydrogenase family)